MKSVTTSVFFLLVAGIVYSQENNQFIHKHLLRADASIVMGYLFKENMKNVHVSGNAEYYLDNTISIRGSATYMMGSNGFTSDSVGLKDFHTIMLGGVYHIQTKGHLDPYIIIQPGLAYTSSFNERYTIHQGDERKVTSYGAVLTPIATAGIGFNYYFQRFAHLFVDTRYVYGTHLSQAPAPLSLEELRITFGLGFNLFIIKDKKESRS